MPITTAQTYQAKEMYQRQNKLQIPSSPTEFRVTNTSIHLIIPIKIKTMISWSTSNH